ncbi:MAG: ABC transporter ATP-binding protein [Cyanobacteria bacterium J06635_15]
MTQSILRLDNLSKRYGHRAPYAVEAATLALQTGDILGLLGPSGCGKTTLLRLIAGFEQPQGGTIELAGQQVCGANRWLAPEKRDIGIVFQDYALFPHLTVYKNVAFGLKYLADKGVLGAKHQRDRTQEAIALVGLQGFENRYPHEISGGQQQRVALARALAPQPSLILLDEPFSNLDVQVRLYLRQEVRDILKSIGASAVFVTHDQEEAMAISDCLAVMRQGRIEQFGTPEKIYRHPASRFVAEFVTQANFVTAQRNGTLWETEVGSFQACDTQSHAAQVRDAEANGRTGTLMIRQEDLQLEPDETALLMVRDRHFLGREYKYCLQTPSNRTLHARTPIHMRFPVGAKVRAKVAEGQLSFFPDETIEAVAQSRQQAASAA